MPLQALRLHARQDVTVSPQTCTAQHPSGTFVTVLDSQLSEVTVCASVGSCCTRLKLFTDVAGHTNLSCTVHFWDLLRVRCIRNAVAAAESVLQDLLAGNEFTGTGRQAKTIGGLSSLPWPHTAADLVLREARIESFGLYRCAEDASTLAFCHDTASRIHVFLTLLGIISSTR